MLNKKQIQALELKSKTIESLHMKETFALKDVNESLAHSQFSEVTIKTNSKDMSILRALGHKSDIPGSG